MGSYSCNSLVLPRSPLPCSIWGNRMVEWAAEYAYGASWVISLSWASVISSWVWFFCSESATNSNLPNHPLWFYGQWCFCEYCKEVIVEAPRTLPSNMTLIYGAVASMIKIHGSQNCVWVGGVLMGIDSHYYPGYPLAKHLLPVSVILDSANLEVILPKGGMLLINWNPGLPPHVVEPAGTK